uniref:Major facilitator superfamily protein n=1 Tax=Phyllotreta armoraciae TaxID=1553667 RepID=A0A858Z6Z2_9CUCU|nr:major facilitator superfamily protein [Phyllotreta armoraciae]
MRSTSNSQSYLNNEGYGRSWFVYFCSITSDLLCISYGFTTSWSSSIIPQLQSNNSEVNPLSRPITALETSALAALPSVFGMLGVFGLLVTSKISDKAGRKATLLFVAITVILSYLVLAFAKHISIYYICLACIGWCDGLMILNLSAYNSEISLNRDRGKLLCLQGIMVPAGSTIAYFSGYTSVRNIAFIALICPSLFLGLSYFLPESPLSLVNDEKRCTQVLERLRGTKHVDMEYLLLKKSKTNAKKFTVLDVFKSRAPIKGFLLSVGLFAAQSVSGIYMLTAFMAPIFNEAGSYISGNAIGVMAGFIQIICVFCAAFFVERLGRRPLLLSSNIFIILNLSCMGAYFYLRQTEVLLYGQLQWLPILLVATYYIAYSIGMGPLPWTIMCDLFSNDLRTVGFSIVVVISYLQVFLILFSIPLIGEAMGIYFCVWLQCGMSMMAFIGIYFTIPETRGKSIEEMQIKLAAH